MSKYDFKSLKEAILFNTVEVLPTNQEQLDQEIQTLVDLANSSGQKIRHYIGYEISGRLHFANNTYQMLKIAKLQQAGVKCSVFLADYHTWINRKLDGKLETIEKVAREYFIPVMKIALKNCGGKPEELDFISAKTEYALVKDGLTFWDYELKVGQNITLNRIMRSLSIAGKEASEGTDYTLTRYPGMQACDVFWMQTHLCQGGIDQRKIYVSTRDIADKLDLDIALKLGNKVVKPVAMFSKLLLGMEAPKKATQNLNQQEVSKMSKSKPDGAIFEHDDLETIKTKLKKAYCPMVDSNLSLQENEQIQSANPILNWCENLIYPAGRKIVLVRPEKFGGNKEYVSFEDLKNDYLNNLIHPLDLKNAVAENLANWFEPIKVWAGQNSEVLNFVKSLRK
jgi:tyrosyl-tRNA synthetase